MGVSAGDVDMCGSKGVIMRFVWRSLDVGMGVLGWDECELWGVDGWLGKFWESGDSNFTFTSYA